MNGPSSPTETTAGSNQTAPTSNGVVNETTASFNGVLDNTTTTMLDNSGDNVLELEEFKNGTVIENAHQESQ